LVSAAGATIAPMTRRAPEYASYPRRQHARWALKASIYQMAAVLLSGLAVLALAARVDLGAGQGMYELAGGCFALALVLFHAHALAADRATRNAIGAQSEQQIHDVLEQLRPYGYTITHGVRWAGGGDIDHLVRAPDGLGVCIETKTRNFDERHLDRLRRQADSLARRRREYPRGVLPILCIARERDTQRLADGVLIVSPDRLRDAITSARAAA
jgi:hypothetical protein